MSRENWGEAARKSRRFIPAAERDLALEGRQLLATGMVRGEILDRLYPFRQLRPLPANRAIHSIQTQVKFGGKIVEVTDNDGEHYEVGVIGNGTVRVAPLSNGSAGIILDGTDDRSELVIEKKVKREGKNNAHRFPIGQTRQDGVLNVGSVTVSSGRISQILGYHTAVLSGPVVVGSTDPVDRIAFDTILPGASIQVGGDLNTLNVVNGAIFSGAGTGLFVGRDLNLATIGGNLTLENNAQVLIGRDIGLVPQTAKGTGPGSQNPTLPAPTVESPGNVDVIGGSIQGNLTINPGSNFRVGRNIQNPLLIAGNVVGSTRFAVLGTIARVEVLGSVTG